MDMTESVWLPALNFYIVWEEKKYSIRLLELLDFFTVDFHLTAQNDRWFQHVNDIKVPYLDLGKKRGYDHIVPSSGLRILNRGWLYG